MISSNSTIEKGKFTPFTPEQESAWLGAVDEKTGAPMNLRIAVSTARRPADKLQIIRKLYPDAKPFKDTFVYTNPETGRPTLFDEKGLTLRDAAEAAPMVGEMSGALMGGMLGAAGGPVGAIAGAGAGGMLGRQVTEMNARAATGTQDTRGFQQQAVDALTSAGASANGEGLGRLVGPAFQGMSNALRPVMTAASEAGARLKVPLTAGMQSGKMFWQNVEAALASNPVTTGVMKDAAEASLTGSAQAANRIGQQLAGGQTTVRAGFGDALKGASEKVVHQFNRTREAMDQAIGAVIPDQTMVPLPNVNAVVQQLEAFAAQSPNALGPEVEPALAAARAVLEDAAKNNGSIPFSALRRFRTTVGEKTDFGSLGDRVPGAKQHLQQLYNGLKQDILNAGKMLDDQAVNAGLPAPGARQAIELHDAFIRVNRDPTKKVSLETFKEIVEGSNVADPTAWAVGLVRDPRKAIALRNQISRMAGPQEWDVLAGTIFEDMGRAAAGAQNVAGDVWSPSAFLTNWNKMGAAGRNALFGGTRYAPAQQAINDLAEVAMAQKSAGRLANSSNTARALLVPLAIAGGLSSASGAGLEAGGVALSSYAAAKLMTSPTALRVITGLAKAGAETPRALGPGIAKLIAIGRTDKALGDAINEYLGAAHQAGLPMPNYQGIDSLNQGSPPSVQFTPR